MSSLTPAPVAYDYTAQRWVTDRTAALELRRSQLNQTLALLRSDRGEEYFRFSRSSTSNVNTLAEAIRCVESQLASL